MRERDFRRIALGMEGAVEGAHMGHPDFRVQNRIFATRHHDRAFGGLALTPTQQERLLGEHPDAFEPASGAWGRAGATRSRSHGRARLPRSRRARLSARSCPRGATHSNR
jgi:hypothetical protein